MMTTTAHESSVHERYASAAQARETELCCPVSYDPRLLEVIPPEVVEKDYGCGDPSRHLHPGETVLDLGSGTGKICFIASQVVGPEGRVIGVDMTDAMLEVARRNAPVVAGRVGYANVEFRKGRIQDLGLDLELLDQELARAPVRDAAGWLALEATAGALRRDRPLVASGSVDVVVSNCVLNLVDHHHKGSLFKELRRVLRPGGRAVISDIVGDEEVPPQLRADPQLWSGCISGAYTEEGLLDAFTAEGFVGVEIMARDDAPWRTVEGIEFRSLTVRAWRGSDEPCLERNQAVVYKGPFARVMDDEGHALDRGRRYAVCDRTYRLFQNPAYRDHFALVPPREEVPPESAQPFGCEGARLRHPRETKGAGYRATTGGDSCCC